MKNRTPLRFLDQIFDQEAATIGFKIFVNQDNKTMNYLIDEPSIKKVILERKSRLRSFVSEQIAVQSGVWDRLEGEAPRLNKIMVDLSDLAAYQEKIDHLLNTWENRLKNTWQEHLRLSYEELTDQFPTQKIGEYIGAKINRLDVEVDQKKQNPFLLRDIVINYEELMHSPYLNLK